MSTPDVSSRGQDDLLPNVKIVPQLATTACGSGGARSALTSALLQLPGLSAVFGPFCSGSVREVSKEPGRHETPRGHTEFERKTLMTALAAPCPR